MSAKGFTCASILFTLCHFTYEASYEDKTKKQIMINIFLYIVLVPAEGNVQHMVRALNLK